MYETHFNGGRCFRVFIDPRQKLATIGYAMYKEYPIVMSECKDERKHIQDEDEDEDNTYLLDRFLRYKKVWIARLPKTEVNLSKGVQHFKANSKLYAGNSILFLIYSPSEEKAMNLKKSPKPQSRKVAKSPKRSKASRKPSETLQYEYLFVGDCVFTFRTRSPIVQFDSDLSFPNDIAYPYAIDANGDYYFMNERQIAPAEFMRSPASRPMTHEVDRVSFKWYADAHQENPMFRRFEIDMLIPNPL